MRRGRSASGLVSKGSSPARRSGTPGGRVNATSRAVEPIGLGTDELEQGHAVQP